jgi:hypothetical protein
MTPLSGQGISMRAKVIARLFIVTACAVFLCPKAGASDVKFGDWQYDKQQDRYYCEYQYPAKGNVTKINIQIMIWYPNDKERRNYYYFANKKNEIWGKCVCPANPAYNPDEMQWSKMVGGKWEELPKGKCPAPGDGDPERASIDKIPKPPV